MAPEFKVSQQLWTAAQRHLPGGVNSPVRAFGGVGGDPIFIDRAKGCRFTDVDGNEYIDHVCSWGPLILGHANNAILERLSEVAANGTSFGIPTALETELADRIVDVVPSIEKVRLVSSGTEATMSAIRLARGYTGRDFVVKFEGCYHGHADGLLVKAGSGATTLGVPTSAGVPADYAKYTLTLPYNNVDSVRELCDAKGSEIACIIVEPVAGNMGVIPPEPGFLEGLREITSQHGIVLVFDEVITGFRLGLGGAQKTFGVTPDLTTLGKIIGGGLPVGAYGGRAEIMDRLAPTGPVYQAGTLSGNPLAVAAGLTTIELLSEDGTYEKLDKLGDRLATGLRQAAEKAGIKTYHTRIGSMMCMFFTNQPVRNYQGALNCDTELYARYFHAMLDRGIYLAPSQFEACFVSLAHTESDIDQTIAQATEALAAVS
jgi:glutamate-1-semialdehyde 2,1-aminomutase